VLIVLASIIAFVSAANIWVKRQALDTDNWANTSGSLLENDEIRQAISVYMVDQLYSNVDVTARLQERLPDRLDPIAPSLAAALEGVAVRAADELLSRPRVQELWKEANRRAQRLFQAVIEDKNERLRTTNGQVVLDLRPLIEQLGERQGILARAAQKLPPDAGQLVIMDSKQLDTAQKAVKVIKFLSYFLGILVIALYALAIFLAGPGRRRSALLHSGFALLTVGILLLALRRLLGTWVVDSLVDNPDFKDASSAAYSIATHLLRDVAVNVIVYAVLFIVAAWIAGPSRPATATRRWLAPAFRDHPVLVYLVVTGGLLIFLATGPTDSARLIPLLILFGFAYLGVELLRRQTAREFPAPPGPTA
jgi:hypothetical protein